MFGPRLLLLLSLILNASGGNVKFNPQEDFCCGGVLSKGVTGLMGCCGPHPYNTTEQACCGSKLYPYPSSSRLYFCCEDSAGVKKPYDYVNKICCNGNILDVKDGKTRYCCNGKLYSETTHLCCNDTLVEAKPDLNCCGGQIYNEKEQTCCQNFPKDKIGAAPESRLIKREGNLTQCCGWDLYDPDKDTCCNGSIKPLPKSYHPGNWILCCKDQPYVPDKEHCCEILESTANGPMAVATKVNLKHEWSLCCGLETINYRNQVCCGNGTFLQKPKGQEGPSFGGCCEGKVILNTDEEMCFKGKIVPRQDYSYCADVPYNVSSEFCCGQKILQRNTDIGCCGRDLPYDPKKEICCDSEVHPLTEEDIKAGRIACC